MPGTTRRTALVSGGNRGIGLEVCRQLAHWGHRVLLCARDAGKGEAAASALRRDDGLDVTPVPLDTADPASVGRLARDHPEIDILVNNAGVHLDDGARPLELDEEVLRATLETNLMGPFRLARAFVPGMAERGWGRVANVSSGMGQLGDMGGGSLAYRASKTALNALTRVLAREVDGRRVKVNAACPG
jgi:NAD(P)-dependent dehydrogenase (short-subunit alcohol dehydrogenase family)